MGIPLMRTKTWAYAIGAFFGGSRGRLRRTFNSGAFPSQFDFNISIFLLCMVILGGMGRPSGASGRGCDPRVG
jgi:branched-chain amino acid transport system permease protein